MIQPSLTVTFQWKDGRTSPAAPQYAGVQGDHGRCTVRFLPPAETVGDNVYFHIELVTGCGTLAVGDLQQTDGDGAVSQLLTRPFTESGGRCCVRLIGTEMDEAGNELSAATVMTGAVYFENREAEALPVIKRSLSEMLMAVAKDAETAEKSALAAERHAELTADYYEEMAPFYIFYGETDFGEIWNASENGQTLIFCKENSGIVGHPVYIDDADRAVFEYVAEDGTVRYATVDTDSNWSEQEAAYTPTAALPQFRCTTLVYGEELAIPMNSILFAKGVTCSVLSGGMPLLASAQSVLLFATDSGGTRSAIAQYTYSGGGSSAVNFHITDTVVIRNTSESGLLTVIYIK